jgi:hypothetical protein
MHGKSELENLENWRLAAKLKAITTQKTILKITASDTSKCIQALSSSKQKKSNMRTL